MRAQMLKNPQNSPFLLGHVNPHLIHECLGRPHSPRQRQLYRDMHFCTTTQRIPQLVTMGSRVEQAMGQGGRRPPPQILMQWGKTRPFPPSDGVTVYGVTEIR